MPFLGNGVGGRMTISPHYNIYIYIYIYIYIHTYIHINEQENFVTLLLFLHMT